MGVLAFLPALIIVLLYIAVVVGILYLIIKWVNQFLQLKKEHNDLLREIIKKMDNN